jgi:SAM-dependent methyltransferase
MKIDNPAFNYDQDRINYSHYRRTDARVAAYVHRALGESKTVLNVGAGGGSYEPEDRYVVSVEPSSVMRAQRAANNKVPAIIGKADALPFDDNAFDASMAIATIHHWPEIDKGLKEMRRVTKGPVVIMTFDPDSLDEFWNAQYFPEVVAAEKQRYPKIAQIVECLGGNCEIVKVPVPLDCIDGFQEAFYGRPEAFLQKEVRQAQSAWGFVSEEVEARCVQALADDLASGEWDRKYGHYRTTKEWVGTIRLVIGK